MRVHWGLTSYGLPEGRIEGGGLACWSGTLPLESLSVPPSRPPALPPFPLTLPMVDGVVEGIWLSGGLQGEMSATVFYHPGSYEKLLPILKKRILRGKPESMYDNVETGDHCSSYVVNMHCLTLPLQLMLQHSCLACTAGWRLCLP